MQQDDISQGEKPSTITGDIFVRWTPKATLKAWGPWDHCRQILFSLQNSDLDSEHPEWRTEWVAGVALLRSIGHVLDKVDSRQSDLHRREITDAWTTWKKDRKTNWILWEFIEEERNNILKAYDFGVTDADDESGLKTSIKDGAQLFREAVYWWREQLEELERKLP